MDSCGHLAQAPSGVSPENADGCVDCLRAGKRDWIHLRLCLACGHVGCCDSSPSQHASAHFATTTHPVVRSFEPGETWRWCFVDQQLG